MKPQDELKGLLRMIKLTPEQAKKRDFLQLFLDSKFKTHIVDADSLLYNVAYATLDDEFNEQDVFNRYTTQIANIERFISDEIDVKMIETVHCFTTCKQNFRNDLVTDYKANREVTPLSERVSKIKKLVISTISTLEGNTVMSDSMFLEADDIISQLARELSDECIVSAIDKDIKQIPCVHFNYYKSKVVDNSGDPVKEWHELENGVTIERQKREFKGFSTTSESEGYELLLCQLLIGDSADNIKGVRGVGAKTAAKLMKDKTDFAKLLTVARKYEDINRLRTNIKLMIL